MSSSVLFVSTNQSADSLPVDLTAPASSATSQTMPSSRMPSRCLFESLVLNCPSFMILGDLHARSSEIEKCQMENGSGAPGTTRTCDPLIRSQVLYPTELRVRERMKASLRFRV